MKNPFPVADRMMRRLEALEPSRQISVKSDKGFKSFEA